MRLGQPGDYPSAQRFRAPSRKERVNSEPLRREGQRLEDKISKSDRLVKTCLVLLAINTAALAANVTLSEEIADKLGLR